MATVYRAVDAKLGRTVAIKVLHPEFARDKPFLQRFQQEAEFAASLGAHPNIVDIYDIGEDGDLHYIVMEFVEGSTLKDLIRDRRRFDVPAAFAIGQQVASALAFAHRRGLVHRDVKPQNILVTPDGQAKVTDFGIARGSSASQLTRTGMVIGTVHYFSPEQAQGKTLGPAADIYSLGIILYEMLTGHLPFDAENAIGVAMQHIHSVPPNPADFNPSITPHASATVLRALAKNPEDRYRDASEFAAALATGAGDAPSGTTVLSPIVPQQTAVYTAVPAATGAVPIPGPAPATPRTVTTSRSTSPLLWALLALLAIAVIAAGAFFFVTGANPLGLVGHPTATPRATATATPRPKKKATARPTASPTSPPAATATMPPPTVAPTKPPRPTAAPTRPPRPTSTTPAVTPTINPFPSVTPSVGAPIG